MNNEAKVQDLVHDALTCDMTLPWRMVMRFEIADPRCKWGYISTLQETGMDLVSLTVGTDEDGVEDTIRGLAAERMAFRQYPDKYLLIETADDIWEAKRSRKLGVSFNFQGAGPVSRELGLVDVYYKMGVKQMNLAYNQRNWAGDGCHERTDTGLSDFGVRLIEEMNNVGMIVDLSHSGYRTAMEAIEVSSAPVILSHSNPEELVQHPRNVKDDLIKACAASGGLIGANGIGIFLGENDPDKARAAFVNTIDYMCGLVGPEHVGLGIDFVYDLDALERLVLGSDPGKFPKSGGYERPQNLFFLSHGDIPYVVEGLLQKGFSDDDVKAILGMNYLRVCAEVWKQ